MRVIVFGDSVTFDAVPAITALLESTGAAVVTSRAIGGIGFAQLPDVESYFVDDLLGSEPPDAMVVMVGGWDFEAALNDPTHYRRLIDEALVPLDAAGVGVVWLTMPPTPPGEGNEAGRTVVNTVYRNAAVAWPDRIALIDTATLLGDEDGDFARFLPGIDGLPVQIRKVRDGRDDGHLCQAGAALLADAVYTALADGFALPEPAVDWSAGLWTIDPRYDDPPGACIAIG